MMLIRYSIFLLVGLCLSSLSVGMMAAEQANLDAKRLAELLSAFDSLQADFNQRVIDSSGELLQEYKGTITVKKPGKLYWESFEPLAQIVVSDNQTLWYYDADLEQVTIRPVSDELSFTPAMILGGDTEKLSTHFTIKKMLEDAGSLQFELKPITEDKVFERLILKFEKETLVQIELFDSLDQITSIQFSGMQINPVLQDALFNFVPPPGTDVLQDE